jgi:hypothetical protein
MKNDRLRGYARVNWFIVVEDVGRVSFLGGQGVVGEHVVGSGETDLGWKGMKEGWNQNL